MIKLYKILFLLFDLYVMGGEGVPNQTQYALEKVDKLKRMEWLKVLPFCVKWVPDSRKDIKLTRKLFLLLAIHSKDIE